MSRPNRCPIVNTVLKFDQDVFVIHWPFLDNTAEFEQCCPVKYGKHCQCGINYTYLFEVLLNAHTELVMLVAIFPTCDLQMAQP